MNGVVGRLGMYSQARGLWQVFFPQASGAKAVRPENLRLLEEPSGAPELPEEGPPPEKKPRLEEPAELDGGEVRLADEAAGPLAACEASEEPEGPSPSKRARTGERGEHIGLEEVKTC